MVSVRRQIMMTRELIILLSSAALVACAHRNGPADHSVRAESIKVFQLDDDAMIGCHEVGLVAETDGAIDLSEECSCKHPELAVGTEEGAISRAATAVSALGGNALWVLHVWNGSESWTHCLQECCSVSGYRVYGVAFNCDDETLRWHLEHEALRRRQKAA